MAEFVHSERRGRSCALRDRSGGPGKDSSQGGGPSHAPALRQRLRPENAPVRELSKLTAPNFPPYAKIALVHVTESRVPMNQVLYMTAVAGGPSHAQGRPPTSFSKTSTPVRNDGRGHG